MLHPNFTPFPYLSTTQCQLRPMRMEDAEQVFYLRTDDRVLKYLDREKMQSLDEAKALTEKIINAVAANENINWAICLKGNDTMIGSIAFWRLVKEHFRAEIGYNLHPDHWGKGIMNEAMKVVLEYGFGEMGLHSVEANVNPANEASIRLLEKNGFIREAYFRENYYFNGKFLDSAIYSLLANAKEL